MTRVTILDGGMGHELRRMGAPFSRPLWSAEALIKAPDDVVKAHLAFIAAGAEIITVNSYACVPFHLGEALYRQRGAELARLAAALATRAVALSNTPVQVAGALPPALGSYRPDLFDADIARDIGETLFRAQAEHVDLWIAETISSLAEFDIQYAILSQSESPHYYSFTLADDSESSRLRSGERVTEVAERLCQSNATGLLFNCSIPEVMGQALQEAKKVIEHQNSALRLGVYANKFTPIKAKHRADTEVLEMRAIAPDDYLTYAKQWHQLGASIIGGCCGIGPEYIAQLRQWQRQMDE